MNEEIARLSEQRDILRAEVLSITQERDLLLGTNESLKSQNALLVDEIIGNKREMLTSKEQLEQTLTEVSKIATVLNSEIDLQKTLMAVISDNTRAIEGSMSNVKLEMQDFTGQLANLKNISIDIQTGLLTVAQEIKTSSMNLLMIMKDSVTEIIKDILPLAERIAWSKNKEIELNNRDLGITTREQNVQKRENVVATLEKDLIKEEK
jgi:hypothetical protein